MRIHKALIFFLAFVLTGPLFAQTGTGTLRGQVKDPSGASIAGAAVVVTGPTGQVSRVTTNRQGFYEVKNLAPGKYKIEAAAKGFGLSEKDDVQVSANQIQEADIALAIETQQQQVTVNSTAPTLSINPANNAGAIVLQGKDLEALSDDPDELQSDLQALAGPSAGPNGGQMYIDGFTAGQLPPKSAIREIRINQNPFSTEYDKLGYGRIEIFTKPGTDKYHGQIELNGNDSSFNSMNPFAVSEPGYDSTLWNGSVGGPLGKKASFFFSAQRRNINDVDVLDACVLTNDTNPALFQGPGGTFAPGSGSGNSSACSSIQQPGVSPFYASIPTPRTRTNVSPRLDLQVSKNNTLSVRYQYFRNNQQNELGTIDLPSQSYDTLGTEQTLQLDDTQVIGTHMVNETRFQYLHDVNNQTPFATTPTVSVLGAFSGGGANQQLVNDTTNHYELQNYTSIDHGKHSLIFGARLRWVTDDSVANSNFQGNFSFATLAAYEQTEQNIAASQPANANGGGANQFSINLGTPATSVTMFDAGLYIQDDWRVRPNITISPGLRLESQDNISDHADWAPRIAVAWAIGKGKTGAPKTVLRAGTGIFYDRFAEGQVLQATRLNGVTQQEYIAPFPSCYFTTAPAQPVTLASIESMCPGGQSLPTVYRIAPNIHAPGTLQSAVTVEQQLTKVSTLSVSYLNSRGWDQLLTNNINTPILGTYPSSPVYPLGIPGNVYEYQSEGVFRQNEFITNLTVRAGSNVSIFGYYVLNYANSDTAGTGSFPSNPYSISEDYGRASFDVRNRVFMGGTVGLPWGLRLSPFMIASSGIPYSITIQQDLIGSSQFNQRPAPATGPGTGVVDTQFGYFNIDPGPTQPRIPINSETGPSQFTLNIRLSKTFGFGKSKEGAGGAGFPGGGGGGRGGGGRGRPFGMSGGMFGGMGNATTRPYNVTLSVSGRNVFNNVNLAAPIGAINSPFFGQSNSLAGGAFSSTSANRSITLQAEFSF